MRQISEKLKIFVVLHLREDGVSSDLVERTEIIATGDYCRKAYIMSGFFYLSIAPALF